MNDLLVVKVGGSLFDWPDLAPRLRHWLAVSRNESRILLVPGGGATADAIRTFDRIHTLGDERAHWLALRALTLNAHILRSILPEALLIDEPSADMPSLAILDAVAFLLADEDRHGRTIPHSWEATSDAVAARVAVATGASRLVLLKSATIATEEMDWDEMARHGLVDPVFPAILRTARHEMAVSVVNLRQWMP
jgi:5-(aminomethyl)-3-furanmethanol phosphate kinase